MESALETNTKKYKSLFFIHGLSTLFNSVGLKKSIEQYTSFEDLYLVKQSKYDEDSINSFRYAKDSTHSAFTAKISKTEITYLKEERKVLIDDEYTEVSSSVREELQNLSISKILKDYMLRTYIRPNNKDVISSQINNFLNMTDKLYFNKETFKSILDIDIYEDSYKARQYNDLIISNSTESILQDIVLLFRHYKEELRSVLLTIKDKICFDKKFLYCFLFSKEIDIVEMGLDIDPNTIEDMKDFFLNKETFLKEKSSPNFIFSREIVEVAEIYFQALFEKKKFLDNLKAHRVKKDRTKMELFIKLSSLAGLVDNKQGRYIRSETSDKRALRLLKSVFSHWDKVSNQSDFLATLSDIKHESSYNYIISKVPKQFLFMFIANPLRNNWHSKQIFEKRMNV